MTAPTSERRRSSQSGAIALVAFISVAVHATIFATGSVGGGGRQADGREPLTTAVEPAMAFSCWGDASLGLVTRELACTVPGLRGEGCAEVALQDFAFDWLLCEGLEKTPPTDALALLTPKDIEALEPMPLLDVPEQDELELAKLLEEEIAEKAEQAEQAASNPRERGQVIEITAPELESTPETARFLSEFDSFTEKETVARGSAEEMVAKPSPKDIPVADEESEGDEGDAAGEEALEELLASDSSSENDADGEGDERTAEALMAMRELQYRARSEAGEASGVDALAANGLAAKRGDGSEDVAGQRAQEAQEAASGGARSPGGIPNLRPSQDTLSRLAGGGSVDKLDGVESGEFTALNTKKWKYASFFNRMKRQVAQNWHPDEVYMRRDPTGKVYGTKNRVTVLEVSLEPGGKLSKVVVIEESGVGFLDSEAVAAFERAQPFPNPPTGLIASNSGLITFSFGFHFQVGAPRTGWKVFRQR